MSKSDFHPFTFDQQLFLESVTVHGNVIDHFKANSLDAIKSILESILTCFKNGGKVLLIGNGGSAADCQHIAGELVGRYKLNRIPLPALALTTDSSVITCIANDYEYESIYSRQIAAIGKKEDILWSFSTSGTSINILKAVEVARDLGIETISFTGKAGSELQSRSDICLCADTNETSHAQEVHQLAYHIICKYIDRHYDKNESSG